MTKLENGWYGHAPIQSDTSIRVYTTDDTDTNTPCVGVPATCNIRPGRSLRERSLYAMGGTCRPLATQTCALSQLTCRNIRVIGSWLLLSLPAGGGSAEWWWPRPVLRGLCVTGMPISGYSLLLPPFSPTLSRIMDHKTALHACVRGGRVTGPLNALWSSCVMRSVNSWWTCSDARNIGDTTVANTIRYDTPSIGSDTIPIR